MSQKDSPTRAPIGLLTAFFTAAVFASAALIFLVEPMVSKMVLPLYGGSAAVWSTCVLFFQALLMGGYLYAHFAPRWLGRGRHAIAHLVLLALPLAALPITVRSWIPPDPTHPVLSLLGVLAASLGAPFFMLSGTAPLLQAWFAGSRHPGRDNPYFLYAASNLGSLGALLSYPLLVEPHIPLARQSTAWAAGYALLVGLIAACVLLIGIARRGPATGATEAPGTGSSLASDSPRISNWQRARWVLLALVPSSLMLGVTTHLTTDVAAVPLLWVLPLAIYLLTFVFVFVRRQLVRPQWMLHAQAVALPVLVFLMIWHPISSPSRLILLHLFAFGVTAMVCHGELARSRPTAERLTEYYIWLSLGGMLGSMVNVLIAPAIFDTVLEYPIMLVLACALRPAQDNVDHPGSPGRRSTWWWIALVVLLILILKYAETTAARTAPPWETPAILFLSGIGCLAMFQVRGRPLALAASVAIVLAGGAIIDASRTDVLYAKRNFYGVRSVLAVGTMHILFHGGTRHGAQDFLPARRHEPLSYYSVRGPLGAVFRELALPSGPRRVAVVGLGAGTAAAYGRPGDAWVFYEIDAAMERLARDPRCFTYLSDCRADVRVVIGDGRLAIAQAPDASFDLVILDAFNSDAIPVHLLTRQALDTYRRKIARGGALAFHISSQHLNLEPVIAGLAHDEGMVARVCYDPGDLGSGVSPAKWAVMAPDSMTLGTLLRSPDWRPPTPDPDVHLWTDDYSNIFQVLIR